MVRRDKQNYYLDMAQVALERSTCLRRQYGAVIVKDDEIISTGYNGGIRGGDNCCEIGECQREKFGIPHGEQYEKCYAVHAEQNAIIQAAVLGTSTRGATLYCTHQPCILCAKMIVNAGIVRVVYGAGYPDPFALEIFREAGVQVECYNEEEGV